jgi:hypothetical protein
MNYSVTINGASLTLPHDSGENVTPFRVIEGDAVSDDKLAERHLVAIRETLKPLLNAMGDAQRDGFLVQWAGTTTDQSGRVQIVDLHLVRQWR